MIKVSDTSLQKNFSDAEIKNSTIEKKLFLDPLIKNIVATLNLGVSINLQTLANKCKNTEYNPKAC